MAYTPPQGFTTRPTLQGDFGMAASTHWLASASAMSVLERGGNAFDAAVAAGFVLQVVEPHLNGIGGELVAILATAADPTPVVLNGTGPAPGAATIEDMTARGLAAMPGAGLLSAPVPGQFDAWLVLLRDYGTWDPGDALGYAIHYARTGFVVDAKLHSAIATMQDVFRRHWPSSGRTWLEAGRAPAVGTVWTNPVLADTLERLVEAGRGSTREARIEAMRTEWTEGFIAREILDFCAEPSWHPQDVHHPGLLDAEDLAGFRASVEQPVVGTFRGHRVAKVGGWSQGPALLQMLGMLEDRTDDELDPSQVAGAHRILETIKLAMADRDAYLGGDDPPVGRLLDPQYLSGRRSTIKDSASLEWRPGHVPGHVPYQPPLVTSSDTARAHGSGEPTITRDGSTRGDTCHLDVADRWGNIVSATPSGGWLQSSPTIPALGFALSTRLQQSWLDPASPARLRAGGRPRITLTPTLVTAPDGTLTALGSPGGDGQDQWQLLYLLRTIVGGYSPQQAIDAPAFSSTSFPDSFWPRHWTPGGVLVEDRLGDAVIDGLSRRGHVITLMGPWSLGRLSMVSRHPDGRLSAAANPRGAQGYAAGR